MFLKGCLYTMDNPRKDIQYLVLQSFNRLRNNQSEISDLYQDWIPELELEFKSNNLKATDTFLPSYNMNLFLAVLYHYKLFSKNPL